MRVADAVRVGNALRGLPSNERAKTCAVLAADFTGKNRIPGLTVKRFAQACGFTRSEDIRYIESLVRQKGSDAH